MDSQPSGGLDGVDVAVAHWGIRSPGGAEQVAVAIAETLGVDRIHTVGRPDAETRRAYDIEFHDVLEDLSASALRRAQARSRAFEYAVWEDVDWRAYGPPDLLVTSGATTRAVLTPDPTLHVNYCHSPPRWLYDRYHDRVAGLPWPVALAARPALRYLRTRDAAVDDRVGAYLANSPVIARRLWKFYNRDAEVVYPPVDVERYEAGPRGEFYLHVGRLDAEKGVEAVVEAFADLGQELVLVGPDGDATAAVERRVAAAPNVERRGFVPEAEKRDLLARCRAVVFNGASEDFGIVPIEALASGKATLAREEGFPGLFVREGETGLLHDGTAAGIRRAVERFEADPFGPDPAAAERFSRERFERELRETLAAEYRAFRERFAVEK
jgi:glycosyltransferase involved in cell wall biosynthesis